MSTYAYCESCSGPLDVPSITDTVLGLIKCPHCGTDSDKSLDMFTRRMDLDEFVSEVRNLRQEVDRAGPVITLRDHFAMAAMTGLLADANAPCQFADEWAKYAYLMADAMMKEREKSDD